MKKNRWILIITLILLIVAVVLLLTNTTSTLTGERSEFALEDTSKVVQIYLADKEGNEVNLMRLENGSWELNGEHHANKRKMDLLLKTMSELKVRAPVAKSAHNTVVKRLATNAVKVEVYEIVPRINIFDWITLFPHKKKTKTYFVGGPSQDNMSTYMLMEGADKPYMVYIPMFRGFISPRYSALEDDWRDHQVFKHEMEEIRIIDLKFFKEAEKSYRVHNIDNINFDLIDMPEGDTLSDYDNLRLLNFVNSFADIKFEAILNNKLERAFIDSVISSEPLHRITIVDKEQDSTVVTTWFKKGFSDLYQEDGAAMEPYDLDRMYALVNDDKDFVLIQYFVFDKVLRPLSFFTGQPQ